MRRAARRRAIHGKPGAAAGPAIVVPAGQPRIVERQEDGVDGTGVRRREVRGLELVARLPIPADDGAGELEALLDALTIDEQVTRAGDGIVVSANENRVLRRIRGSEAERRAVLAPGAVVVERHLTAVAQQ